MRVLMLSLLSLLLSACATPPAPSAALRPETVIAVNDQAELLRFNAGQPERVTARLPLQGLPAGDTLVGIDFRVARGVLYALSSSGQLYTLNTENARLTPVGSAAPAVLQGQRFGVDFNPAADRVRVVSDQGQNLRLHPDTGAVAATDATLAYAPADTAPRTPQVSAAGYTYNPDEDKLTTNYAIDLAAGTLVMPRHQRCAQHAPGSLACGRTDPFVSVEPEHRSGQPAGHRPRRTGAVGHGH